MPLWLRGLVVDKPRCLRAELAQQLAFKLQARPPSLCQRHVALRSSGSWPAGLRPGGATAPGAFFSESASGAGSARAGRGGVEPDREHAPLPAQRGLVRARRSGERTVLVAGGRVGSGDHNRRHPLGEGLLCHRRDRPSRTVNLSAVAWATGS